MTLHLRCPTCSFLDIVLRENANNWVCPKCDIKSYVSEWIKVTDRLPEFNHRVLAWDGDEIQLAFREDGCSFDPNPYWTFYDYMEWNGVTHWRELPKEPEDE